LKIQGQQRPLVFEMDRITFPNGHVAFEVEIELKGDVARGGGEAAKTAIEAVLVGAGVKPQSGPSKAKRFFGIVSESRSSGEPPHV
jgi:hypothetical protein